MHRAPGIDVLLVTGMRDESPVAAFSHLVLYSRLLEVRVNTSEDTLRAHGVYYRGNEGGDQGRSPEGDGCGRSSGPAPARRPGLIFSNDITRSKPAGRFAESSLLPFLYEDL